MPRRDSHNTNQGCISWIFQLTGFLADAYYLFDSLLLRNELIAPRPVILLSFQFPRPAYPFVLFWGNVWINYWVWRIIYNRYLGEVESIVYGIVLTLTCATGNAIFYALVMDNWFLIFRLDFFLVFAAFPGFLGFVIYSVLSASRR